MAKRPNLNLPETATMKLAYDTEIMPLEGEEPYKGDGGKNLTLRGAIVTSCSATLPGDEQMDVMTKYKVGEIAVCAHKGLPLTVEQVSTVKTRVAKCYNSPVLVYLLHQHLEGEIK